MNRLDKHKVNEMLMSIPHEYDIEITIVKTMGDTLMFYNYEMDKVRLFDDYLAFIEEGGKQYKVMYGNIIQFKWKPVFKDKRIISTVEGEINEKRL